MAKIRKIKVTPLVVNSNSSNILNMKKVFIISHLYDDIDDLFGNNNYFFNLFPLQPFKYNLIG